MSATAARIGVASPLRYSDTAARLWIWSGAPLYWHNKVTFKFIDVEFFQLETAATLRHWDVLACWTKSIAKARAIPPLVVNRTPAGLYYIHDGNHRYSAIRICFRNRLARLRVRVAIAEPKPEFEFAYRQFATHHTYMLRRIPRSQPEVDVVSLPIITEFQPQLYGQELGG
jgi:hypothetical protein